MSISLFIKRFFSVISIIAIVMFLVLQVVPSLQVYLRKGTLKNAIVDMRNITFDEYFVVDSSKYAGQDDSISSHYGRIGSDRQIFGSPIRDGPDKLAGEGCHWSNGLLTCSFMN